MGHEYRAGKPFLIESIRKYRFGTVVPHNNHHRFMFACRQGILWWEVDFTYYALRLLNSFGVARELRGVRPPAREPEVQA